MITLAIALAGSGLSSISLGAADAPGAPPAFPVTVAQPIVKHIKTWDEYSGRFEAVARVEIRARVCGYIDKVNFKEGSTVKQGDLLFTLDKRPYEIAVEAAKAEVARNKAQVDFAKPRSNAPRPLVESKALSEQVFQQRKSTLGVAKAQVKAAEAATQVGRPQPRMDRGTCADLRPHLGPQGRSRQPRSGGQTTPRCWPPSSPSTRSISCSMSPRRTICAIRA